MSTPTARDVVLAALAAVVPCPTCGRFEVCRCEPSGRTEARADLIVAALVEHGHLPGPDQATVTRTDMEAVARWLADQSRHPRYTQVTDGWTTILQSTADVELAAAKALDNAVNESDRDSVRHARSLLLGWVTPREEHPA